MFVLEICGGVLVHKNDKRGRPSDEEARVLTTFALGMGLVSVPVCAMVI